MIRHEATTETFREVAKKGWTESLYDGPNAATFLDDLAGHIIDDQVTTGDELIDALVAWYSHTLKRETIDRFDRLDRGLTADMIGQAALVVSRTKSRRAPYEVQAMYGVGIVNDEGLVCDLMAGKAYIPTDGHLSIGGIRKVVQESRPIVVNSIFPNGYDDVYRFLAYGTPDFSKQYTVDGRCQEAFNPDDYATPLDAVESRQSPVQVLVGTENVQTFLADNQAVGEQIVQLGATGQVEDLLAGAA